MSSEFGSRLRVSIFGESHGAAIGVVLDNLPAGEPVDEAAVASFLARRAGGKRTSTARREPDAPIFLSGLRDGRTTGAPLCAVIQNTDARSGDYGNLADLPRPSHADYPAWVKYGGANDIRGGGHFSGRLTAPLCIAGALCAQILARRGVTVGAHIAAIAGIRDERFDPVHVAPETLRAVAAKEFPVLDDAAGERMTARILEAKSALDSVGGIVECAAVGLPPGVGSPLFGGVENRLSAAIFGIGAVRGIEFGDGFAAAEMTGSAHNDPYRMTAGAVRAATNHAGGVLGGLTSGMPLVFRVAFKPTASIAQEQQTVSLSAREDRTLAIRGRHDPCIVPRAVPCVEAAAAITLLDILLEDKE